MTDATLTYVENNCKNRPGSSIKCHTKQLNKQFAYVLYPQINAYHYVMQRELSRLMFIFYEPIPWHNQYRNMRPKTPDTWITIIDCGIFCLHRQFFEQELKYLIIIYYRWHFVEIWCQGTKTEQFWYMYYQNGTSSAIVPPMRRF